MDDDLWAQCDPAYGKRQEFARLTRSAGRAANDRSSAAIQGAENLLRKAVRALGEDDEAKARRLIDRAAAMPWDERDEDSAGIRGACMLVYSSVVDRFEDSDPDDPLWLDVAIDVLRVAEGWGRLELASVVHGIALQESLSDPTDDEVRRIEDAAA